VSNSAVADNAGEDLLQSITPQEFEQIRRLAYDKFGLDLRNGKEHLVSARLGKKIREARFRSFREYYEHVVQDRTGEALTAMIDALTTNYTSFLREPAHFDFLQQTILPELSDRSQISIWSAACSTGEEPYTIAFSLLEKLGRVPSSKISILATDISTRVLATAQKAVYPGERFQSFSQDMQRKYLLRGENRWQGWYRIKKEIASLVTFRQLNLIEPFSQVGQFPVIFCRNVMIYFDKPTQTDVVNRLAACMEPGGYLLIGHAESLTGIDCPFQYVRPATYRKVGGKLEAPGRKTLSK
jgi:chemotaxis protein methyltransferase CheR